MIRDSLACGTLGMMGVGGSLHESVTHIVRGLSFMKKELGSKNLSQTEEGLRFSTILAMFLELQQRLLVPRQPNNNSTTSLRS